MPSLASSEALKSIVVYYMYVLYCTFFQIVSCSSTSVTPVTQDHFYSICASEKHEILYYIIQNQNYDIKFDNLTKRTILLRTPFSFNIDKRTIMYIWKKIQCTVVFLCPHFSHFSFLFISLTIISLTISLTIISLTTSLTIISLTISLFYVLILVS